MINHSNDPHFSDAALLVFLHKPQLQWRKSKSFKEENNQSAKQKWYSACQTINGLTSQDTI